MSVQNVSTSGLIEQLAETAEVALYRLFGAEQQLLYVGISSSPVTRWAEHKADKVWWSEVRSYTLEWLPNRVDALRCESDAIKSEGPRYNIVGSDKHRGLGFVAPPEVQQVLDLIDALGEGKSPAERAGRLTELLKSVGEKVRLERRQALLEMQAAGMTLREISKVSGISFARVRQILADDPESPGRSG